MSYTCFDHYQPLLLLLHRPKLFNFSNDFSGVEEQRETVLSSLIDNSWPGSMNSVTASASAYISLSLSISPPTSKAWTQFLPGKCKPLISSNFDCKCRALGEGSQSETQSQTTQPTIYQGIYGPWTVEDSDIREVILYRSGLVTAAASFVLASSAALLPNDSVMSNLIEKNLDLFFAIGSCGLGLSLFLIHIYVTEIKRSLQALWFLGAIGSLATYSTLAHPAGTNLVQYVIENPIAVWFVGPLFAALTGLVFKEGLCYGKLEAGLLTFVIPSLLLGHLTGIMDDGVKITLLSTWLALFVVFAGRKFTQPIKDDIGDKSVFIFNDLPEEEKADFIKRLEQQPYTKQEP